MANRKTLKIGRSDFGLMVGNNHYFVDKTRLIYDFYYSASDIMLFPRPKRFGKTLNLSMIEHFFDIHKSESKKLFDEFEIAENQDFCEQHQNKYPVINITLKNIKGTSWTKCLEAFKSQISKLYQKHRYLLDSDKLEENEKLIFEKIIIKTANETEFKESLESLSRYLQKHFNKEVIILVDEYDTPIINAFKYTNPPIKTFQSGKLTFYEKVINFMQGFLGDAYKGNSALLKGMLTGVMRVGRESIFSEWNNFKVFDIKSAYFSDKFGFTAAETKKILSYFNLEKHEKNVQKWYDGYQFGKTDRIYNPWSIVNFIEYEQDGFVAYWVNSGDDSMIKERLGEPNIKETIHELIAGKTIVKTIKENFVFSDFEYRAELLWTLLFYNGFLTKAKKVSRNRYELKIPNYEIRFVFTDLLLEWIENRYRVNQDLLITTSKHLVSNNIADFEIGFKKIIGDTLSYFDISPVKDRKSKTTLIQKEQFFHVYTLGLLAVLSDDYLIKSNQESGEGRYDIALIPHNLKNNGVIIEIKSVENQRDKEKKEDFKQRINREITNASEQIDRKKYYKDLVDHKVALNKILRVPIVFAGKEPYITKFKL